MKSNTKSSTWSLLAVLVFIPAFLLCLNTWVTAQESGTGSKEEKICRVHSVSMNRICREWDGQWQGITVGSDGACYFGSSTHSKSHGAGFHKFEPETKTHTVLAEDVTLVCGEGNTLSQQGKIHSPIVESDGWLYFNTHLSNYWKQGIERYTGAHTIGYEMATGKFRDFGVIRPRYSSYSAIDVDPVHNKLYVFVAPFLDELIENDGCHLYRIDIETGKKEDLGRVTDRRKGACFWFFVDRQGNCWFTLWKHRELNPHDKGNLYCYRPGTGKIETHSDVLPKGRLIDGTQVTNDTLLRKRAWTWAGAMPGREKCYFTMGAWGGGDERLWIFDPSKDVLSGEAFREVAPIGSTFLQVAIGGDRLFFVQYADLEDERKLNSEKERERDPDKVGYWENLHLRSISLKAGSDHSIRDHGRIIDQDGRAARMITSLAADDKGNVYMYGSWYIKSLKEATLQYLWQKHPEGDLYRLLKRGEFFGFYENPEKPE